MYICFFLTACQITVDFDYERIFVYTTKWMCDSQHEIWSPQNYSLGFPSFFSTLFTTKPKKTESSNIERQP